MSAATSTTKRCGPSSRMAASCRPSRLPATCERRVRGDQARSTRANRGLGGVRPGRGGGGGGGRAGAPAAGAPAAGAPAAAGAGGGGGRGGGGGGGGCSIEQPGAAGGRGAGGRGGGGGANAALDALTPERR